MNENKYKIFEIEYEGTPKDYVILNSDYNIIFSIIYNLFNEYYFIKDNTKDGEGIDDTHIFRDKHKVHGKYISYIEMDKNALLIYRKQLIIDEIIINL